MVLLRTFTILNGEHLHGHKLFQIWPEGSGGSFFSSKKIQGSLNYPIWGESNNTNGKFEGFPLKTSAWSLGWCHIFMTFDIFPQIFGLTSKFSMKLPQSIGNPSLLTQRFAATFRSAMTWISRRKVVEVLRWRNQCHNSLSITRVGCPSIPSSPLRCGFFCFSFYFLGGWLVGQRFAKS